MIEMMKEFKCVDSIHLQIFANALGKCIIKLDFKDRFFFLREKSRMRIPRDKKKLSQCRLLRKSFKEPAELSETNQKEMYFSK